MLFDINYCSLLSVKKKRQKKTTNFEKGIKIEETRKRKKSVAVSGGGKKWKMIFSSLFLIKMIKRHFLSFLHQRTERDKEEEE